MDKSTAYCAIKADGGLHGSSYDQKYIEKLPARFHSKIFTMAEKEGGDWNPVTEKFDQRPEQLLLSPDKVISLLDDDEQDRVFSSTDETVKAFVGKLSLTKFTVDIKSDWVVRHFANMEALNLISGGKLAGVNRG